MEIGIYITAHISSVRAIFGRPYRQFLTVREMSCCHTVQCSWPLAEGVQQVTCPFIALTLDVFCLHAEAEGAILHATKRFEECAQNLTFPVVGAKETLWLRLYRKFVLQNVGWFEWV